MLPLPYTHVNAFVAGLRLPGNVVFDNAIDAKRAVVTMGKPLPPEEAPDSYG